MTAPVYSAVMPHAFVTGATGFLGLNLIPTLRNAGWRVTALHRASSDLRYLERLDADRVEGAVDDLDSVRRAMPANVDVVFHAAADTNLWSRYNARQTRTNVDGTRNVVTAALERGAGRVVHTSSIAAYGLHPARIDESTPQIGADSWINYLRTKGLAEAEVRHGIERGLDAVILNPANIVGPFDLRNWSTMIWLVHHGKLPGAPPGGGSFCHVREVAAAHVAAVEHGRTGENYLLGGVDAPYLDVTRIAGELTDRRVPARATAPWMIRLAARGGTWLAALTGKRPAVTPETATIVCADWTCGFEKAQDELGYRTTPLRNMVEDCWRWMVEEGRLA